MNVRFYLRELAQLKIWSGAIALRLNKNWSVRALGCLNTKCVCTECRGLISSFCFASTLRASRFVPEACHTNQSLRNFRDRESHNLTEMKIEIDGSGDTLVMLAHGAGGSMEAKTILKLRDVLVGQGAKVARFNFLYKEEGRGMPDRMPKLMERYAEAVEQVRSEGKRLIMGGHSMGGRTASMLAAELFPMDGLLLLAYPLHPAGQPTKLRDEHLPKISVPTLCINGTKDELCTRELMEAVLPRLQPNFQMHWLEGADHSYSVSKKETGRTNAEVMAEIGQSFGEFLTHLA